MRTKPLWTKLPLRMELLGTELLRTELPLRWERSLRTELLRAELPLRMELLRAELLRAELPSRAESLRARSRASEPRGGVSQRLSAVLHSRAISRAGAEACPRPEHAGPTEHTGTLGGRDGRPSVVEVRA